MGMRTMTHNSRTNSKGRVHGAKHNDRNFDVSKADNIDVSKMKLNNYQNCFNDPSLTFEEAELKAYKNLFSKQLQETNDKYIKNRHPERCKTMEQFIKSRQYCPEETTLQIGKTESHVDRETLIAVYNDYKTRMSDWNKTHGRPFVLLDIALHCDEAVPHVQQRRAWRYKDDDGIWRVGQEKALERAGVPLPHPEKPVGRYNNRKMTFDKMSRELWLDVCHEHGLSVEREAVPDGRHNRDKEDMIRDKFETMQQQTKEAEQALAVAKRDLEKTKTKNQNLKAEVEVLRSKTQILTSAEVAEAVKTAQKSLFGSDMVKIPLKQLEALERTAKASDEAQRIAAQLSSERETAKRHADQTIAAARKQAQQIVDDAAKSANEGIIERAKNKAELERYRKLEERFPARFEEMRNHVKQEKNRNKNHNKSSHGREK